MELTELTRSAVRMPEMAQSILAQGMVRCEREFGKERMGNDHILHIQVCHNGD